MPKAYRVYFTDSCNGCPNQKILEVSCVLDIFKYMASLGHTVTKIEEA
jgi:hypothetical protein